MAEWQERDAVVRIAEVEAVCKFMNALVGAGCNLTMALAERGPENRGCLALRPNRDAPPEESSAGLCFVFPDVGNDRAANRLVRQFADFGQTGLDQVGIGERRSA